MRNGVIATLLVIAILAGAGAGYFIGANSTLGTSSATPSTSTQTTCHISGETIGVALHVVALNYSDHSTIPVVGAGVSGEGVVYCNDERQVTPIAYITTNSSGWVNLFQDGGGMYYLNVTYPNSRLVFSLSIPVPPVTATYATFNVSTGNMTTHFCEYNYHCAVGG